MLKTTTCRLDKDYEILGLVQGNVVRSKHVGKDIMASFKNIVGGELKGYTEMMTESRDIATSRMEGQAKELGADAIIGMRYVSSTITPGTSEVIAYGTAVKFK